MQLKNGVTPIIPLMGYLYFGNGRRYLILTAISDWIQDTGPPQPILKKNELIRGLLRFSRRKPRRM